MKYGLNQAGFPHDDFEETCRILDVAGYDGIEPNYIEGEPITTTQGRDRLFEVVDQFDLAVPAVSTTLHWEYPLSSADPDARQRGIDIGKEMIDAASALNADEVLIVPAYITPGDDYERCYERAVKAVHELIHYASATDVTVAIENVQNNFLYSPREFVDFLETVSDAGPVTAYFDVGNGFRWGLPERWLSELNEWISKIHVKDWLTADHRPTYPLQGDIDWNTVVDTVDEIGYDGWITFEAPAYETHPERMPAQVLENLQYLFDSETGAPSPTTD